MLLIFICLALCGCVHHRGGSPILPSAVPEKHITRTSIPGNSAGGPADAAGDDPWRQCTQIFSSEKELLKVSDLHPEEFRRRVQITFMVQDADAETSFIISRCMNGKLYACLVSEKTNCVDKLDLSTEPNDVMKEICADPELEGGILTSRLTGINSAYQWVCHDGKAVISAQIAEADSAGYDRSLWVEIPAPEPYNLDRNE